MKHIFQTITAKASQATFSHILQVLCVWGSYFVFSLFSHASEVVKVATVEWPPYFSAGFPEQGLLADMAKKAFAHSGITAEVHFMPWMRAMRLGKIGAYNAVLGAYRSEEREREYFYSQTLVHTNLGFVTLKSSKGRVTYGGDLESLNPYVVGIMKGHVYRADFDGHTTLKKRGTNEKITLISWLFTNDVDMIVGNQEVLMQVAKEQFPTRHAELYNLSPPLERHSLHLIFAKSLDSSKSLLEQFDKGLEKMKASKEWHELAKKHGFTPETL